MRIVISSGGDAPVLKSADGNTRSSPPALLDVLGDPGDDVAGVQSLVARIRERVTDSPPARGPRAEPEAHGGGRGGDEGGTYFFVSR
ncbi:MAG: hypothetical protein DMF56_09655 [Acidobacteria bacterium]|nr:MAG: hypothetical protein DMF56_09655 [Acidobacteriota bacterium]